MREAKTLVETSVLLPRGFAAKAIANMGTTPNTRSAREIGTTIHNTLPDHLDRLIKRHPL